MPYLRSNDVRGSAQLSRFFRQDKATGMITPYQQQKLDQLQNELNAQRPRIAKPQVAWVADGYAATVVEGVTVVLIRRRSSKPYGGYILPALMTYPEEGQRPKTSLDAAIWADDLFRDQLPAAIRQKGHKGPIVKQNWRCDDPNCQCQNEGRAELARRNGVALQ